MPGTLIMNDESSSAQRFKSGDVVAARYTVESAIGEGTSGVVYAARRNSDGARVALKVVHRSLCYDDQFTRRFLREAEILKRLEGNHIVRLLDVVTHDDLPVLVLEYVEGRSLEAVLGHRPATIDDATEIALQICAALGAAHAGGFVHRDLKPANVIVQGELGSGRVPMVWVVDFGLGKALHRDGTAPLATGMTDGNMILGTPEYMSPEQVRGDDVDHRCDIYAAGVILFEMLTGRPPFVARTPMHTMTAHLNDPIPSVRGTSPDRGISPALEAVVFRSLAKDPAERYPTARALAEALAAARHQAHVVAPQPVTAEDVHALALKDTELELRDAAAEARRTAAVVQEVPAPVSAPARSKLWVIIAVVLALVAVLVGASIGSR